MTKTQKAIEDYKRKFASKGGNARAKLPNLSAIMTDAAKVIWPIRNENSRRLATGLPKMTYAERKDFASRIKH